MAKKPTTFLAEIEIIKKELKQQESKYLLLLQEHVNEKDAMSGAIASTESQLQHLILAFDDQNKKLKDMESGNSEVSQELRKVLDENKEMKLEILRLSQLANKENEETNLVNLTAAFKEMESGASVTSQELKKVFVENGELKSEVVRLSQLINNKMGNEPVELNYAELNDEERTIFKYNSLPCQTAAKLKKFGDDIKNPKVFISMQKFLLLFGGNMNKFIAHVLNKIMDKELQRNMSLTRHRSTKSEALNDFHTVTNLIHTTAKLKFECYEIENGEKIISNFLKIQ